MIQKLQRKFLLAAMLSLFLVLASLITVINVLNYRSVVAEADDALQLMSEVDLDARGGRFFFGGVDAEAAWERGDGNGRGQRRDFNGETPFQWRYFSVDLSESGELLTVNLQTIVTVDEETAVSMAQQAAKKGRTSGFSADYRYLGVQALGESGITLKFIVEIEEGNIFTVPRILNHDLLLGFRKLGVECPFPQLDVHSR